MTSLPHPHPREGLDTGTPGELAEGGLEVALSGGLTLPGPAHHTALPHRDIDVPDSARDLADAMEPLRP